MSKYKLDSSWYEEVDWEKYKDEKTDFIDFSNLSNYRKI